MTNSTLDLKHCRKCDSYKESVEFSKMSSAGDGKHPYCKACMKSYLSLLKALRKDNPIPKDHRCPICERSEAQIPYTGKKMRSVWRIDHCHISDEFRGWLCIACNQALGMLGDKPDNMKRAISYLHNGHS